jgi:predicted PurR-regulated permease PerM
MERDLARNDLHRLISLALVFAAAWVVWRLSTVLTPFVVAALLAYLGRPLMLRLRAHGLSDAISATLVLLLEILILLAVLGLLLPLLIAQGSAIVVATPLALQSLGEMLESSGIVLPDGATLIGMAQQHAGEIASVAEDGLAGLIASGAGIATLIGNLLLIPVLTFYGLRDSERVSTWVLARFPADRRQRFSRLTAVSDEALSGFLRGQLAVMGALAVIYAVGLGIIGIEYGIALGVFAGLVSFVPYLGTVIGLALALLMALTQGAGIGVFAGVVATFGVGQLLEGMVLTPFLVGDRIGLHPALVIFAILAGGALFGFLGVLVALPASAVIVAVLTSISDAERPASEASVGDA